jgi:hypothetical protein
VLRKFEDMESPQAKEPKIRDEMRAAGAAMLQQVLPLCACTC